MRDQVQRSVVNACRLDSLTIGVSKGQATSPVIDEVIASVASSSQAPSWNMELIEQLAEHGSHRNTKCPSERRTCDAFDQCKSLGRSLLQVLRHVPEEVYLKMDQDGWVHVEQLGEVINHWCNGNTRWQASSLQSLLRELVWAIAFSLIGSGAGRLTAIARSVTSQPRLPSQLNHSFTERAPRIGSLSNALDWRR